MCQCYQRCTHFCPAHSYSFPFPDSGAAAPSALSPDHTPVLTTLELETQIKVRGSRHACRGARLDEQQLGWLSYGAAPPPGLSLVAERVTPARAPLYKLWGPSTLSPRNQGAVRGR